MSTSAVNLGHQQANQAEYHSELQQWKQAKDCHELAAKYFLEALDCSTDPEIRNTLILLNKNHTREAQTIQETHLSKPLKKKNSLSSNLFDERRPVDAFYPTRISSEPSLGLNNSNLNNNSSNDNSSSAMHSLYKSGFPAIQLNDESFMLLKDQELDPFDRFLDTVEDLVQKISNPVAFTTVPLNFESKPKKQIPKHIESNKMTESFYLVPSPKDHNNYDGESELIPSKTIEEYCEENYQLKIAVDQLTKQLHSVEKTSEENNNLLKSSIMQFKTDVQKQAQQLRVSQDMLKSSILIKNRNLLSNEAIGSVLYGSTSKLSNSCLGNCKKVKELEEEIKTLQAELSQKNDIINMHKKRWENLKQSAKKRGSNNN